METGEKQFLDFLNRKLLNLLMQVVKINLGSHSIHKEKVCMTISFDDFFEYKYLNKRLATLKHVKSTGVDGVNISQLTSRKKEELSIVSRKVKADSYTFSRYKQKLIIKDAHSLPREVVIPTNRDRLVMHCLSDYLDSIFPQIKKNSQHRKTIKEVLQLVNQNTYTHFIKLDIARFFPSIDHSLLIENLSQRKLHPSSLVLIKQLIRQSTSKGLIENNVSGVPQGLPISGLLSELFIQSIDEKFKGLVDCEYFRYVDDVFVLCYEKNIDELSKDLTSAFKVLGLTVHPASLDGSKSERGLIDKGTDYLGYFLSSDLISVRQSSIDKMYVSLNKIFVSQYKYKDEVDLEDFYQLLNLKITGCTVDNVSYGWLFYFQHINDLTLLNKLDCYVRGLFKRYGADYDGHKVKRFVRAFYEMKKIKKTNYIPSYNNLKTISFKKLLMKLDT